MDKPMRPEQEAMFKFIEQNRDKKVLLIEAPTGAGKSPVCMTLAKACSGKIMTPQKILQDQYTRDWPEVPLVKGRANYQCVSRKGNCETFSKVCASSKCGSCPYKQAANEFYEGRAGITNYSYLLSSLTADYDGSVEKLADTEWLIFDEGHSLEAQLIEAAAVELDEDTLEMLGFQAPTRMTLSPQQVRNFVGPVLEKIDKELTKVEKLIGSYQSMDDPDLGDAATGELNKANRLLKIANSCQNLLIELDEGVEWVSHSDGTTFVAKPLEIDGLFDKYVAPLDKKILLTSATMVPPETAAKWFGWSPEDYASTQIKSPFPVNNRAVYFKPVGWMSKKNKDTVLPKIVDFIDYLLDLYPDKKGIIHCHSFALGEDILSMSRNLRRRVLHHKRTSDREALLQEHATNPEPTVLLSPSMNEGVDLKDDLARFVIIPKMPYPSLGDPWVKRRLDTNPEWYSLQVIMTIVQACGRAVRHKEDYADSYILDGNFKRLLNDYRPFFPKWFLEALVEA